MASAQVQHDAGVIGSLVAEAFPFRGKSDFFGCETHPTPPCSSARCTTPSYCRPCCRPRPAFQRNPASFHAPSGRLAGPNHAGFPQHLALYLATSSHRSKRLIKSVFSSIEVVKNSLKRSITELSVVLPISNKMFQPEIIWLYCPIHAALRRETPTHPTWDGGSTCHKCGNTIKGL